MKLASIVKKKMLKEESDKIDIIPELYKYMKRVGLKPEKGSIEKDTSYPNSYICRYHSIGNFSIKTFVDLQKLCGGWITFKPEQNRLLIWFNFDK